MSLSIAVGVLAACGVFLLFQRGMVRITLGVVLLSNAANLALLASGGQARRGAPIVGESATPADPLPQAFVLTAIVIGLGVTVLALALAMRLHDLFGDDDTEEGP